MDDAAVHGRLMLILVYVCPECGQETAQEVKTLQHWIFDIAEAFAMCPFCEAGLAVSRPDPESLPDSLSDIIDRLE